jgi:hypothetical protein
VNPHDENTLILHAHKPARAYRAEQAGRHGLNATSALGECSNVIWIPGGDSPIKTQQDANMVRAMAEGIRSGLSARRLISLPPPSGSVIPSATPLPRSGARTMTRCRAAIQAHPLQEGTAFVLVGVSPMLRAGAQTVR